MCNPVQSISDAVNGVTTSIAQVVAPIDPIGSQLGLAAVDASNNPNVQKAAPLVAAAVAAYYTGGAVGGEELAAGLSGEASGVAVAAPYVVDGASLAADGSLVADAVAGGASAASAGGFTLADVVKGSSNVNQLASTIGILGGLGNHTASIVRGATYLPNASGATSPQIISRADTGVAGGTGGTGAAQSKGPSIGTIAALMAGAVLIILGAKHGT